MDQVSGRVIIYGGRGALGSQCVSLFKSNNLWTISIDFTENPEADLNIILNKDEDVATHEKHILAVLSNTIENVKLDAIICVAGGWTSGNASNDLIKNSELMWKQSVSSSLIAASIASKYLKEGGLLTLTGAKAALEGTPEMIGYGIAKAAVHQLVKSLADDKSGLPRGVTVLAVLPIVLDTPLNRTYMRNGDTTTWTPLEFVSDIFMKWTKGEERPTNGSLCQLLTINSLTKIILT